MNDVSNEIMNICEQGNEIPNEYQFDGFDF